MTARTAQSLMQVAEQFKDKSKSLSHLGREALYLLAAPSTPQEVRDHVDALVLDGQKVTAADVRRLKADAADAEERVGRLEAEKLQERFPGAALFPKGRGAA